MSDCLITLFILSMMVNALGWFLVWAINDERTAYRQRWQEESARCSQKEKRIDCLTAKLNTHRKCAEDLQKILEVYQKD